MTAGQDLVLLALRSAYDADRAANPPRLCLVTTACAWCGKHRTVLAGSRINGHALCIVTDAFRLALVGLLREHLWLSMRLVAETLDVSERTVRAWWAWWEKRP